MKQALVEGALLLESTTMFEQGAGRLNLLGSYAVLADYVPRASILPSKLDLTDCPYSWPFCRQPLYATAMPVIFNATILNGMGVVGWLEAPPLFHPSPSSPNSSLLEVTFTYSEVIWPWTGYLGLFLRVKEEGSAFEGVLEGTVTLTVVAPPGRGEFKERRWDCRLELRVGVIPTPARAQRVLWDQFHSVRYPPGYIPRDSLDVRNDILDWHGDHLHTNFHGAYDAMKDAGYHVEILGSPLTCFNASLYGTLLLVDLEDEYHKEEVSKLASDVMDLGLGVVVFADWFHVATMQRMRFFDDNTRSWWTPATGGANVPALNELLSPFGVAFGASVLSGPIQIGEQRAHFASGTGLIRFPAGGYVHHFSLQDTTAGATSGSSKQDGSGRSQVISPVLGLTTAGAGRLVVFGDSNCIDSSHLVSDCFWLLTRALAFSGADARDASLFQPSNLLTHPLGSLDMPLPVRRSGVNFSDYSLVLGKELSCGLNSPLPLHHTRGLLSLNTPPPSTFLHPSARPRLLTQQREGMTEDGEGGADKAWQDSPLLSSSSSSKPGPDRRRWAVEMHSTTAKASGERHASLHKDKDGDQHEDTGFKRRRHKERSQARVGINREAGQMDAQESAYGNKVFSAQVLDQPKLQAQSQHSGRSGRGKLIGSGREDDGRDTVASIGLLLGWRHGPGAQDEEDNESPNLLQVLFPVGIVAFGFIAVGSLLGVQHRKRRRLRKGPMSRLLSKT
eukprot:SM000126S26285  [mRNA]  locus=s126:92:3575:+ [translate_table: standard]